MKIGIIDNFDSFVYNLVRYVREEGVEVIVQRNNKIDFRELDSCNAILLSPGPGIPTEAGSLIEVIFRYNTTKPILGVCLGHQALGEYFGGKLQQCTEPVHGKASKMNVLNHDSLFANLPDEIEIGRYHSWEIDLSATSELEITGLTSGSVMSFQHKTLPIHGVQFHPESILTPTGRTLIKNWLKTIK
jgi:anthranilate synthase component 2